MNSSDYSRIRKLPVNFVSEPSVEFIRKYNTTFDNIKYCGLCSTGTSRIAKAKNNTHGTSQYNDERFTCTRNKCSAVHRSVYYASVVHEHN